jgi:hypothetical protein
VAYAGSHEWYVISDIWGQGSWFEAFPLRYGGRSDVSQPCEVQLATLSQGSRTLRQAQICCGKRRKLGRSSTPFLGRCDIQGRHPKTGGGEGSGSRTAAFRHLPRRFYGGSACPDVQIFNAHIRADRLQGERYRSTHSGTIEGPALIFADMPGQIGSKYPFCGGESDKIPVLVGTTPTRSLLKYGRRVSLQLGLALFP